MDRYAALKDLDEEFRETKAQAAAQAAVQIQHVGTAATSAVTNGNNVNVMGRFLCILRYFAVIFHVTLKIHS